MTLEHYENLLDILTILIVVIGALRIANEIKALAARKQEE